MRDRLLFTAMLMLATTGACRAAAQPTYLVYDIRPGNATSMLNSPPTIVPYGAGVMLYADDGTNGLEPWISGGTSANTGLLLNIRGSGSSVSTSLAPRVMNARAAFEADDGFLGREIWGTDGTAGGTGMLLDYAAGAASMQFARWRRYGAQWYFLIDNDLWRTNGTPAGTVRVHDNPGATDSPLFVLDGRLRWLANATMMSSDGTTQTVGQDLPAALLSTSVMVPVGKVAYFAGRTAAQGNELWRTDWTTAGTGLVADIAPGAADSSPGIIHADDRVLVFATTPATGRELFVTDGTTAGTTLLRDILPGNNSSEPSIGTTIGGVYFFTAADDQGRELWRSDGTAAGTFRVGDIEPEPPVSGSSTRTMGRLGNRLVVGLDDGTAGEEPWITDGSAGSLQRWEDVNPGSAGSAPRAYVAAAGRLFMVATLGSMLSELFAKEPYGPDDSTLSWCDTPDVALPHVGSDSFVVTLPSFTGNATDIDVELDFDSNYVGDLRVRLTHVPSGTSVLLVDLLQNTSNAVCSADALDVVLDDAAPATLQGNCSTNTTGVAYPRGSSWRPAQPLAALAGKSLAGPWRLDVGDLASGDGAVVKAWCLRFQRASTAVNVFANGFE